MLDRLIPGFAPRLVPTLIAVPGVILLLCLSFWQLSRHFERTAENDLRASRYAMAPVDIDAALADPDLRRFRRVSATGHFDHSHEIHVYARSLNGNEGFFVMTPLVREGKPAVIVNRGWVRKELRDAKLRAEGQIPGTLTIEGVLRDEPRRGWLMPDNLPEKDVWFWFDLPVMSKAMGVPDALPVYVEAALEPRNPGGWPLGGQTQIELPRPHLQYSFTWFALAIALGAIYIISQRQKT
ncbi:MAG: SURF1 family protein [Alphaproteobacteria bacterium]|nr:SURF1 family protein [Alphaproteobacteria bacterium]